MLETKQKIVENLKQLQPFIFKDLSDIEIEKIIEKSFVKNAKKDEKIFEKGEKLLNFFIVISGSVKISGLSAEGEELIFKIIEEGDFLSEPFQNIAAVSSKAIEDCKILAISLQHFQNLIAQIPQLSLNLVKILSEKNSFLLSRIEVLKLMNVEEKLGNFLLESAFAKENSKEKKRRDFKLKIKKSLIASYLGIKAETLSRGLKKIINSEKLLMEKNYIKLGEKSSLCKFCNDKNFQSCADKQSSFCKNS